MRTHPQYSTITFSTIPNTTTDARRHRMNTKGETTAHDAGHNHNHWCPAQFCSLDFGKCNGYLKGVAPIDAQQKSMELLTFSCSRGSP